MNALTVEYFRDFLTDMIPKQFFFQDDGVVKIASIISILWLIKWREKLLIK